MRSSGDVWGVSKSRLSFTLKSGLCGNCGCVGMCMGGSVHKWNIIIIIGVLDIN